MNYPLRDVIPTTRTNTVGKTETFKLSQDIGKQSLDDIQQMMRDIAETETDKQARNGNPPQRFFSDNREGVPISKAEKKIEVFFGVTLPRLAMTTIEAALMAAVRKATGERYPALLSGGAWEWYYLHDGIEQRLSGPTDLEEFKQGDILVLRPTLNYATLVNNIVAHYGSVAYKSRGGSSVGMGFFGFAAQVAKRDPKLRSFTVYAARSKDHELEGEKARGGTAFIAIRAKRAKRYRRI